MSCLIRSRVQTATTCPESSIHTRCSRCRCRNQPWYIRCMSCLPHTPSVSRAFPSAPSPLDPYPSWWAGSPRCANCPWRSSSSCWWTRPPALSSARPDRGTPKHVPAMGVGGLHICSVDFIQWMRWFRIVIVLLLLQTCVCACASISGCNHENLALFLPGWLQWLWSGKNVHVFPLNSCSGHVWNPSTSKEHKSGRTKPPVWFRLEADQTIPMTITKTKCYGRFLCTVGAPCLYPTLPSLKINPTAINPACLVQSTPRVSSPRCCIEMSEVISTRLTFYHGKTEPMCTV